MLRRMLLDLRVLVPAVLTLAVVFAFGVYVRPRALLKALRGFDRFYLLPILALALANYVLRFARWQYFLRVVGLHIERRRSLGIFFSGLAMSVTPGKLGELFKCLMLKREVDAPYAATRAGRRSTNGSPTSSRSCCLRRSVSPPPGRSRGLRRPGVAVVAALVLPSPCRRGSPSVWRRG